MTELPGEASIVIIGGGIIGCSVAYHLAKRGADVVLLERRQLTCGTTWHAAGLVGQLRATHNLTRLARYTAELYATLEQETGQATGFRQVGSLALAASAERFEELKRGASMARCFGARGRGAERRRSGTAVAADGRRRPGRRGAICRRTARPTRSTPPRRSRRARGRGARASSRTLRVDRHPGSRTVAPSGWRPHAGDIRAGLRRQLRRHVGARNRRLGRCHGAAARRRALLYRHRAGPGAAATICRCCATPTPAPTSRRTPASCWSAGSSRWPSRGEWPASRTASASRRCPTISAHIEPLLRGRRSRRVPAARPARRSSSSSTDRKASRRMIAICSARRRRSAICSSPPASTRSASSRPAAPARCWQTGFSTAIRRWTSGTSTSAAPCRSSAIGAICTTAPPKALGLLYAMHWPHRQPETARGVRRSVLHDRLAAARRLLRRGRRV